MPAFDEDDERSQDGSFDGDNDETMQDLDEVDGEGGDDLDVDGDGEGDVEADGDNDAEVEGDENEDDDAESQSEHSDNEEATGEPDATQDGTQQAVSTQADSRVAPESNIATEYLEALTYDIVPTIAAPHSTSINAVCTTSDMRWVFSGGSDGYIRKFNWVDTVNNKLALTVAQRHPFVDSVIKAGTLMSYWENFDARPKTTQNLSPVYSLACQSQALWLLSGTASGPIRLQAVRHDEGREIALLSKHTSAVSVLTLSSDEMSLLSGSWDKSILDWDLNTGQVKTSFAASASQISSIEARPLSSIPVPPESGETVTQNGTFSSNDGKSMTNGFRAENGTQGPDHPTVATPDSLFGDGDDDLFGDDGANVMTNGGGLSDDFAVEDDEMSRAMASEPGIQGAADQSMSDAITTQDITLDGTTQTSTGEMSNGVPATSEPPIANGLPYAEDLEKGHDAQGTDVDGDAPPTSDSTFLATSIDGAIRVWDRRQPEPVARILPRSTPPWCLSACWSPDGNFIYAGRRNNTVEEYDLRKGLKAPERVFRFPNGSGAVTSVKAMPNGRHLICASYDILRLYDLKEPQTQRSTVPFLIVPGHRTGVVSHLFLDPACRFMISTGGNRGWEGNSTEVLLGYEIGVPNR
jgi:transcriptional activator SPT8